ncbi:hypothetical protein ACQY0O_006631 [Thecaphora frezii]
MAQGAYKITVKAIEGSVQSTGRVLMLAITAIEEVLNWIVDSYRSLIVCFIEFLVQDSLAVLMSAMQLISDAVHEAAQGIRAAIQASIEGANSLLQYRVRHQRHRRRLWPARHCTHHRGSFAQRAQQHHAAPRHRGQPAPNELQPPDARWSPSKHGRAHFWAV